jgi:hypothetical protein
MSLSDDVLLVGISVYSWMLEVVMASVQLVVRFERRLGTEMPCTYDCYELCGGMTPRSGICLKSLSILGRSRDGAYRSGGLFWYRALSKFQEILGNSTGIIPLGIFADARRRTSVTPILW